MATPQTPTLSTVDRNRIAEYLQSAGGGQAPKRLRILLALADGEGVRAAARRLGVSTRTVFGVRRRFGLVGWRGLVDAERTRLTEPPFPHYGGPEDVEEWIRGPGRRLLKRQMARQPKALRHLSAVMRRGFTGQEPEQAVVAEMVRVLPAGRRTPEDVAPAVIHHTLHVPWERSTPSESAVLARLRADGVTMSQPTLRRDWSNLHLAPAVAAMKSPVFTKLAPCAGKLMDYEIQPWMRVAAFAVMMRRAPPVSYRSCPVCPALRSLAANLYFEMCAASLSLLPNAPRKSHPSNARTGRTLGQFLAAAKARAPRGESLLIVYEGTVEGDRRLARRWRQQARARVHLVSGWDVQDRRSDLRDLPQRSREWQGLVMALLAQGGKRPV